MRRRDLITLLGGAAAAWPLAARAQQSERTRRVGVLMPLPADDAQAQIRSAAFLQGLQELGWNVGRNVQLDYRWGARDADRARKHAAELVALAPDVILANGGLVVGPLQQVTRTVPIVFVQITDPVGAGFVASLAVIRDPAIVAGIGQLGAIQAVAPSLGVEVNPINVRDADEIESAVTAFARPSNGGLIVTTGGFGIVHRELIARLAARHQLPAVYPYRFFATGGGLISYGADTIDPFRRAAGYVDRILKGEKPAHLPVQNPTKYELVINLKTAKALGLTVPPSLLARADEVIE
jgi:putative ABC transport system substrate-binding protein